MQRIKYNTKYDLNQKIDRSLVGANSFADTVAEEFNSAGGVPVFDATLVLRYFVDF